MGRLATIVTMALVGLLVATGSAGATHDRGRGLGFDLATGAGAVEAGPIVVKLGVLAISGANGERPFGQLVFQGNPPPFGAVDIVGRVTCLSVFGNQATVGFVVTRSKAGFPVGTNGEFSIVDSRKRGTPDRFEGRPTFAQPSLCLPFEAGNEVTKGAFIVHDSTR
jgi:hypothetical protein